jgi:hypothetical protein
MKTSKVKQYETKAASKMGKAILFVAILACLIVAGTGSALAAGPVFRSTTNTTVTGQFNDGGPANVGESVSITEPASIEEVVVTWSGGYVINVPDLYFAGLDVNGRGCESLAYGNRGLPDLSTLAGGDFLSMAFQWVILPSDGVLKPGLNTFGLCIGGESSSSDSITITHNTLLVRLI